jgi:hypothetical protein
MWPHQQSQQQLSITFEVIPWNGNLITSTTCSRKSAYLMLVSKLPQDFILVVNSFRYRFPRVILNAISSTISRLGNSVTHYEIEEKDLPFDFVKQIAALFIGERIRLCQANQSHYQKLNSKLMIPHINLQGANCWFEVQMSPNSVQAVLEAHDKKQSSCFLCVINSQQQQEQEQEPVNLYAVLTSSSLIYQHWIDIGRTQITIPVNNHDEMTILKEFWNEQKLLVTCNNAAILGELGERFGILEMSTKATLYLDELAQDEIKMDILESDHLMTVELQNLLVSIREDQIDIVVNRILESEWISENEKVKELVANICTIADHHPEIGSLLGKVCAILVQKSNSLTSTTSPFVIFKSYFTRIVLIRAPSTRGFFLSSLVKTNIIDIKCIIHLARRYLESPTTDLDFCPDLFYWFLPEIAQVLPLNVWKHPPSVLSDPFMTQLLSQQNADWSTYDRCRESGMRANPIANIVRSDDRDGLQRFLVERNITQPFKIVPSFFECLSDMTLLEYCAHWKSKKCITFLHMIHFSLTPDVENQVIISGDTECIRLIEDWWDKKEDYRFGTPLQAKLAIQSFHDEIFK